MKILVFDTETDGLISNSARKLDKQPKIIEFFGLVLEAKKKKFKEVETISQLFNPGRPIPEKVTQITGITNDMVKVQPSFSKWADEAAEKLPTYDLVVAHNLSYDMDIVNMEFERLNRKIIWPKGICTVEGTEWLKGYRLSLTALHEELFGEKFTGAHRAEEDVRALARCYIELVNREIL